MKKFINKILSLVLSFALVLGVLMPCFSGVFASALTAENAQIKNQLDSACDNLIAAWEQMAGENTPSNLGEFTPYELFSEAVNFNISGYTGTASFVSAKNTLGTLLAGAFNPTALKKAWADIYKTDTIDFLYPFGVTGASTADATYFYTGATGVTVENTAQEDLHIWGKKTATFDYALPINRTNSSNGGKNDYTVFISSDADAYEKGDLSNHYNCLRSVYSADDIYLTFRVNKINTAATGTRIGFRITGYYADQGFGVRDTNYYVDINGAMVGKVITVKFSDLAKAAGHTDWQKGYSINGSISRIECQLCDNDASANASVNITFGTAISVKQKALPTDEESADWTVADWINAAKEVDLTDCFNTDAFVSALNSAEELRKLSGIEIAPSVETTDSLAGESFSDFGNNLLAGIKPEINYYDGISDKKEEKFTPNFKNLTDNILTNGIALNDNQFAGNGAFVELIYDMGKVGIVEKAAVASAETAALRNYKYKLYASKNRGELFTADALITSYTNKNNSAVQVFDYKANADISARYFAIRIYAPACDMASFDNIVRINELGVWGRLKNYEVSASVFSANRIKELGKNLILESTTKPFIRANTGNRQNFTSLFSAEKYPLEYACDADVSTILGVSGNYRMLHKDDYTSLHLYFDLGEAYNIDKFLFSSIEGAFMQIGKYKIHASNDLNQLFTDKSVIADYDNTVDTTVTQIFTMNAPVVARYVSFHITLALCDYESLMALRGKGWEGAAIRFSELGIFGEKYVKPAEQENLLTCIPVEVSRVDENGNKTAVSVSEYLGETHKLTYDGNYEIPAPVNTNGKTLEYLYSIYGTGYIDTLRVVSGNSNVTSLKIYASTVKNAINNESGLIYSYDSAVDGEKKVFEKYFVEAPLKASFIRIVVTTPTDTFSPTEIEAIGWNGGMYEYKNLTLDHADWASYYIQDKSTGEYTSTTENMDKWLPSWSGMYDYQHSALAFDGDLGTVYTYYGGQNNAKSVNIYLSLQTVSYVDDISIYTSLLDDYRPTKMNVYVGNSRNELFASNATPVYQWTEKILSEGAADEDDTTMGDQGADSGEFGEDDPVIDFVTGEIISSGSSSSDNIKEVDKTTPEYLGLYSAKIVPTEITCVRIEILDSNPEYFAHKNKVGGIISEIQINGFEVSRNAVDNIIDTANEMSMRAFDPAVYHDAVANTVKETAQMGSYKGEPIVTVKGIGDSVANSSCNAGVGYVEFRSTSDMTNEVTLADIEDIYFSYKVEKAYSEGSAAARIYICDTLGKWAHNFANYNDTQTVLFIPTSNNQWVETSMSKLVGNEWKSVLVNAFNAQHGTTDKTEADIALKTIRLGFNKSAQADLSFGSMYYEFNEGCNPYANALTNNLGVNNQDPALTFEYYRDGNSLIKRYPTTLGGGKKGEYTDINGIGDTVANSSCSANSGDIVYEVTPDAAAITLDEIENIYFSYKVNKVLSGEKAAARIYIYDQDGILAKTFAVKGTFSVMYLPFTSDGWMQTSIRDIVGENWKNYFVEYYNEDTGTNRTAKDIRISKISLGFNFTGAADMSFGQMYYEYSSSAESSANTTAAIAMLNNARNLIDPTTAKKEDATRFKYSVQMLADVLNMENTESKYLAGDYKKTAPTMKELSLLAQYLDGDLSSDDYIDLNCADINKDGVISEADVTALRKTLMQ